MNMLSYNNFKTVEVTVLVIAMVILVHISPVLSYPAQHTLMHAVTKKTASRSQFQCWSTPDDLPHHNLITHPCFSHQGVVRCRCSNYTQDCSSNFGSLTFVPRVFRGVQALNFSNNQLVRVDDPQFFSNVSAETLSLLDLYNNDMTVLSPAVITRFQNLTTLLIGGNRLSYETLRLSVFTMPTLRKLDIKCGGLRVMPPGYFNDTLAVHLEELDMSWNQIGSLDMESLQPLTRLRKLTMWHNKLYDFKTAYLPSLKHVSFHKNGIADFPRTCREGTNESLFPRLQFLDLNFNLISELADPICLPNLDTLNLQYNRIQFFHSNMFSLSRFPVLRKLFLNQMESEIRHAEGYTFNNSQLENITFGMNFLDFSTIVHRDFFAGCFSVQYVLLNHNDFHSVSVNKFRHLLQPLPQLRLLSVENCGINTLDADAFRNMTSLHALDLNHNALSTIPDGTFDELSSLEHLSVSHNRLASITSTTFSYQTRARLHTLDLSGNPFQCSCDSVWFQQWLKTTPRLFVHEHDVGYNCDNLPNVSVEHFVINEQVCVLTRLAANDIIIITSIIISLFLLFLVVYGHRWHLRLWLYEVCRGRHQRRRRQQQRLLNPFQFDVFLAFAEEDMNWVHQELLPVLENEWGLRACVHQRDFIPGKHIVDNISDSVEDSDRFLLVFSPHFARSSWCQYELRLCQTCVMERDDVMVLVRLEETESRDMTGAMLAVLRTTTYIEWADDHRARKSFWGRTKLALNDLIKDGSSV